MKTFDNRNFEELTYMEKCNLPARYFKKSVNGILDGIGRAITVDYAKRLVADGYEEISAERYLDLSAGDLAINYLIE